MHTGKENDASSLELKGYKPRKLRISPTPHLQLAQLLFIFLTTQKSSQILINPNNATEETELQIGKEGKTPSSLEILHKP